MCATPEHRRCAHGDEGWTDPDDRLYRSLGRRVRNLDRESEDANSIVIRNDIVSFRLRCNKPDRINDVGGAFMPESFYFSYYNFAPIESTYIINNGECTEVNGHIKNPVSAVHMKRRVLEALDSLPSGEEKNIIALFCHGWPDGIQLGFRTNTGMSYRNTSMSDTDALALAISRIASPDVKVILYACSAGANDNGFAATLRDSLVQYCPQCRIDAHKTVAHATKNPHVNRFEAPAGSAGQMIVEPTVHHHLWHRWTTILRHPFEQHSTLLWKYSQMTIPEIHEYLESFELQ